MPSPNPSTTLLGSNPNRVPQDHDAAAQQAAIDYNSALTLASAPSIRRSYFLNQLLAVCGGCNAADAVEILAVSFIMPNATDELHLSSPQKGWLAGMIFAGMMIGGWVWGSLSDRFGRRSCLMSCLAINGISGIASAFAPTFWAMLLCRFASGIGVGGSVPVVFTYFSEFLATRDRGAYMVLISCCWMVGSIATAGMAWAIIPLDFSLPITSDLSFNSWRLFAFLCAWPSIACGAALAFCPESPRWLLARGRTHEAKEVIVQMYEINWKKEMAQTEREAEVAVEADESSDEVDGYADYLESANWRNLWCGICCSSRKRHPQARNFNRLDIESTLPQQTVPPQDASSSSSASSSTSSSSSNSSSTQDLSDTRSLLSAGFNASDGIDEHDDAATSSSSSSSPSAPPSSSSSAPTLAASASIVGGTRIPSLDPAHVRPSSPQPDHAFTDLSLSNLSEHERWTHLIHQLQRLEHFPSEYGPGGMMDGDDDAASPPLDLSPEAMRHTPNVPLDGMQLREHAARHTHAGPRGSTAVSRWTRTRRAIKVILIKTLNVFSRHHRAISIKLTITWFFLAFGYYGLTLWIPQYFSDKAAAASAGSGGGEGGTGTADDLDVYLTALIGALSALPANIISVFTVREYGRIRTLVCSLLLSSICVGLVPVIASEGAAVAMLCIFTGVNTAAWNALNISTTELYETEIRATAFGVFAALGRIGALLGNLMFGELEDASLVVPLFVTAATLLVAALAAAALPETKTHHLA